MITEALLEAAARVLAALVALLPEVPVNVDDFAGVGFNLGAAGMALNAYIPVGAMFTVAGLLVALWAVMAAWNGIVWIYHQFWGSG